MVNLLRKLEKSRGEGSFIFFFVIQMVSPLPAQATQPLYDSFFSNSLYFFISLFLVFQRFFFIIFYAETLENPCINDFNMVSKHLSKQDILSYEEARRGELNGNLEIWDFLELNSLSIGCQSVLQGKVTNAVFISLCSLCFLFYKSVWKCIKNQ